MYRVMQGTFSSDGRGDYHTQKDFTSLVLAKKYFNEIKRDTNGWVKEPNGYLETILERYLIDEDGDKIETETMDIVDSYQVHY